MVGRLPSREAALLLEQGGYSGPQMFERTRELTRRYRILLDEGLHRRVESEGGSDPTTNPQGSTPETSHGNPDENLSPRIEASIARDAQNLKPDTTEAEAESKSQPLIRLPERHNPLSSSDSGSSDVPALSVSHHADQMAPAAPSQPGSSSERNPKPKVIFATGGIVNGKQGKYQLLLKHPSEHDPSLHIYAALEVLEAGASVAQVFTLK